MRKYVCWILSIWITVVNTYVRYLAGFLNYKGAKLHPHLEAKKPMSL